MTRNEIYVEIDRERAYQATLDHTRTDGCAKTVGDYINLLGYYADEARKEWTIHAGTLPAQHMIRKLVACAVACLEAHGCPPRMKNQCEKFPIPFDDGANGNVLTIRPTGIPAKDFPACAAVTTEDFKAAMEGNVSEEQTLRLNAACAEVETKLRSQAIGELEQAHASRIAEQKVKST